MMLVAERPHYVYRCYDDEGHLLYIGCAIDVRGRICHHTALCNSAKRPNGSLRRLMARWESTEYPTLAAARAAERAAIAAERPLLNKQHNPTRFRRVKGSGYALVEPVHPITAAEFDELPMLGAAA